ncbi:hypothetical protein COV81_05905 [Candidatus Peregrinibacteria bacterium CG11_big_fil_rev_8_21_14_0_20_41_10]|nr:MAG: hypothetical protein COV81_05905 [Candidatus Peregrinibacteria bacterium CG11_big_fil_rev_8_21_14_0_20_41_10]PIZ73034.1 MAG: hypothetical protein COY06_05830 [Candidatus Peregrinibacteria bacterium CG_4_10_14_0_2_um_filter_41_8]PJC37767.1 MAG: hypothetical protein CO045_03800 [Candidatus Peregrinibacteria bacterium CG_4_9_14_0_2_um_filter_41_14]
MENRRTYHLTTQPPTMTDQTITCPKCGTQIPLSDALTEKMRHQLEEELGKEYKEKLETDKREMWKIAQEKAAEKIDVELKDLKKANEEKEGQLQQMREQELDLRKQKREIEEKEKNLELEMERKLDEQRKTVAEEAKKDATEEMRLKMAEKDKQLEQMKKSVEELKRKSEQGSMQIQGDVQEDDLKNMLQHNFPVDNVEDVPTGIRGADLVQTVNTSFGNKAGIILWESKNTKAWSDDWLKKLKDDQALVKADVCILVSQTLPDGVKDFKFAGGVWVCSYASALSLVAALRLHLTQLSQVKQSLVGKDEKMELLYNYLSGSEFRNRMENIVSAFTGMKGDLETEKRSMQRIWSKREKEIERVVMSTTGMYGDLQGIVGASLPAIKSLELPSGDED